MEHRWLIVTKREAVGWLSSIPTAPHRTENLGAIGPKIGENMTVVTLDITRIGPYSVGSFFISRFWKSLA